MKNLPPGSCPANALITAENWQGKHPDDLYDQVKPDKLRKLVASLDHLPKSTAGTIYCYCLLYIAWFSGLESSKKKNLMDQLLDMCAILDVAAYLSYEDELVQLRTLGDVLNSLHASTLHSEE